jgi:hypothetical protein
MIHAVILMMMIDDTFLLLKDFYPFFFMALYVLGVLTLYVKSSNGIIRSRRF